MSIQVNPKIAQPDTFEPMVISPLSFENDCIIINTYGQK